MRTLATLFWADLIGIKQWLSTKTISRLLVSLLFGLVFGGIALGLFRVSLFFFTDLALFPQYGQLTASYIIHAAIVIILWLSLGSSLVASLSLILSSNPSLTLLLSLPVPHKWVTKWVFLKAVFTNLTLMLFVFLPITIAYALAFGMLDVSFILLTIEVLTCLVLLSSSIGMLLALPLVTKLRGKEYLMGLLGLLIFFVVMVGLIKLIFPPEMAQLYRIRHAKFDAIFLNLPLNHPQLPTNWLATTITSGAGSWTWQALIMTVLVTSGSVWLQTRLFVKALLNQRSLSDARHVSPYWPRLFRRFPLPLLLKEWLSIWRLPSETGYGVFLFSIATFFFLFLALATRGAYFRGDWQLNLTMFAFYWLMFFTIALLLRFIFPLMAREGKSAWYIFSLPLSRPRILASKLGLALLMSTPLYLLTIMVWWVLPFAVNSQFLMVGHSLLSIFFLTIYQSLLGAIFPNFSQGSEPEKISTSGMGLLALGISIGLIAFAGLLINHISAKETTLLMGTLTMIIGSMFGASLLWFLARKAMKKYER